MGKGGGFMITLYSGTPGSGKSLHCISLMLRILRSGRHVISNFPIKFNEKERKKGYEDLFHYWSNDEININNLVEFAIDKGFLAKGKESQCLVVIDEAGGRFNCRDFQKKDRTEWIDFFSQHRKLGYDFVLVAQNDRMLDKQIRGYIEIEKKHRKVNNFGPFFFLPIPVFVAIEYWYTAKQKVGAEWFMFRKSLGDRYDSMKLFSGFKLSDELLKKVEAAKNGIEHKVEIDDTSINAIFQEPSD